MSFLNEDEPSLERITTSPALLRVEILLEKILKELRDQNNITRSVLAQLININIISSIKEKKIKYTLPKNLPDGNYETKIEDVILDKDGNIEIKIKANVK